MTEHQSSRTLVKSAPELWSECSDAASLARHLGAFGEIRITKLEPETAVAWEGAAASGTVRLETSGWGTRVTLTVTEEERAAEPVAAEPVAAEPEPEPDPVTVEPEPVAAEPEPVAEAPEAVAAEPEPLAAEPEPEPAAEERESEPVSVVAAPRRGMFARFRLFRRKAGAHAPEPLMIEVAEPEPEPVIDAEPEPVAEAEPIPEPGPVAVPEPVAEASAEPESAPRPAPSQPTGEEALVAALDSLGKAHHRPYSRA
jgi:hypothetical protein